MESTLALAALSALAHPGRLAVFRLLVASEPQGLCAGEIAAAVAAAPSTMSTSLTLLSGAGLITAGREGRHIRYRANLANIAGLLGFLVRDCCGGRADLCQPMLDSPTCRC